MADSIERMEGDQRRLRAMQRQCCYLIAVFVVLAGGLAADADDKEAPHPS